MGCGVIGNTADSGSAIPGSSPGIPAMNHSLRSGSWHAEARKSQVHALNPTWFRAKFFRGAHVFCLYSS